MEPYFVIVNKIKNLLDGYFYCEKGDKFTGKAFVSF